MHLIYLGEKAQLYCMWGNSLDRMFTLDDLEMPYIYVCTCALILKIVKIIIIQGPIFALHNMALIG